MVAFLLAAFFSRRITRPLRPIGAAADRVAKGDLEVQRGRRPHRHDELGQLAQRFQGMVDRLREVDELERNFLMRVTHELRTPVTAISGHVQAMNEGLVEPGGAGRLAGGGQRGGAADRAAGRRPARPDPAGGAPVPAGARGGGAGGAAGAGRRPPSARRPARTSVEFDALTVGAPTVDVRRRPGAADRHQPARQRLPLDAQARAPSRSATQRPTAPPRSTSPTPVRASRRADQEAVFHPSTAAAARAAPAWGSRSAVSWRTPWAGG